MPLLSIVIPAYNVAGYLNDCLQSAANQSAPGEIIVVDDGSTDNTLAVAEAFAKEREGIRVLTQKNAGVSAARNNGLSAAGGDYIWFVDGDDMIVPFALRRILRALEETGYPDILYFDHCMYPCEMPKEADAKVRLLSAQDTAALAAQNVFRAKGDASLGVTATSASFCVYKAAFLREKGLCFQAGITKGQDSLFNLRALLCCGKAAHLPLALYLYRRNPGSISIRYLPDAAGTVFPLLRAYKDSIASLGGAQSALFTSRLDCRRVQMCRNSLCLDFCHADNPKPYARRKSDFFAYVNAPDMRGAAWKEVCAASGGYHAAVYRLISARAFFLLNLMYRMNTRLQKRRVRG